MITLRSGIGAALAALTMGVLAGPAMQHASRRPAWTYERRVTGIDPVPPADRGNIDRAAEAWLRWGKEQGMAW